MSITRLHSNSGEVTMIRLYGVLGSKFGRIHYMAVANAAEAVRALSSQIRGFEAFLTQAKDNGLGFAVFYDKKNLTKEELHNPHGHAAIRIAPIILGSKNGGWLNIIIGVVLIVIGFFSYGSTTSEGAAYIAAGIAMAAGGVVQLLTPVPKGSASRDTANNMPSYTFNGAINTEAQGNPVMVVYGENIVGSAVLSAGINSVDQAYVPTRNPKNGGGGGGGSKYPEMEL